MEVRLYGILAEKVGENTVQLQGADTDEILTELQTLIPELRSMSYAVAVNRKIIRNKVNLSGQEEIAVLPPFAGG